ncbi:MAG: septal ring lytic transglycosylase RlpA family protein [Gammaproteobacteria bacterium]
MKPSMHPPISVTALALLGAVTLGGCQEVVRPDFSAPPIPRLPVDPATIPDAEPKSEPLSARGNESPYTRNGREFRVLPSAANYAERGSSTWYGTDFHGRRTANGEIHDMYRMTAAHPTLPLPSFARVTNLRADKSIVVRINDRGPDDGKHLIKLSIAAAGKLGVLDRNEQFVEVRGIDTGATSAPKPMTDTRVREGRPVQAPAAVSTPTPASAPVNTSRPAPVSERRKDGPMDPARYELGSATPKAPDPEPVTGQFYVQAGAFKSEQNAEKLRNRLNRAGITDVSVVKGSSGIGTVFRVYQGPFPNRPAADSALDPLRSLGISGRVVTP